MKEDKVSSDFQVDIIAMPIRITFYNPIDFNDHFFKPKDFKKDLTVELDSPELSTLPSPLLDSDSPFTAELSASITLNSLGNEDKVFKLGLDFINIRLIARNPMKICLFSYDSLGSENKIFDPGTDISKFTRNQTKTGKHGHENQKSTKEAKVFKAEAKKVKSSQQAVNHYKTKPHKNLISVPQLSQKAPKQDGKEKSVISSDLTSSHSRGDTSAMETDIQPKGTKRKTKTNKSKHRVERAKSKVKPIEETTT
ncbi:hypothetical protein Tco_0015734 [Tanacetum coccineum]